MMKKESNPPPPPGIVRPQPPLAPPRSRSGRGGAQKAGPGKKMGAPKKAPGELTVIKGPYRFPPDVAAILGKQLNATKFISLAIRAAGARYGPPDLELRVSIANCRCGQDYVIVNDFGVCPSGCERGAATISEEEGMTIPLDEPDEA